MPEEEARHLALTVAAQQFPDPLWIDALPSALGIGISRSDRRQPRRGAKPPKSPPRAEPAAATAPTAAAVLFPGVVAVQHFHAIDARPTRSEGQ